MKINLFSAFYPETNEERKKELEFCKEKNLLAKFDNYFFWDKTEIPTFNDFFEMMGNYPNEVNVIANGDIFFSEESVTQIRNFFLNYNGDINKVCLALTRWDYFSEEDIRYYDNSNSQDVWCFFGSVYDRELTNLTLGTYCCDGRLAAILHHNLGYHLFNPSLTIKTIHYHITGDRTRTYLDQDKRFKRIIHGHLIAVPPCTL